MSNVLFMHDMKKIEKCFSARGDLLEYIIMDIILQYNDVVGSWTLKNELDILEIHVGTATIGRVLKILDNKGFTVPVSNKGRALTKQGIDEVLKTRSRIQKSVLSNDIVDSVEITHFDDLIEVLSTRLIIEREATRLAVQNATQEDFKQMSDALEQHRMLLSNELDDSRAGLDFHIYIVDAAKNKFMSAVARLLAYEEHQIEAKVPSLSAKKHAMEYVNVHQELLEAIQDRDEERATRLMEEHLNQIIGLVKKDREITL
ncbi:FCD domain-containing protein [Enterocloster bolteae]|jgi:DNA-binding FadR family transcriptional regulator|nr:FCD domain-containing protein [Enterocloster bolteae]